MQLLGLQMRMDLGDHDIAVSEQLLDLKQRNAMLYQPGCKSMPQRMGPDSRIAHPCYSDISFEFVSYPVVQTFFSLRVNT